MKPYIVSDIIQKDNLLTIIDRRYYFVNVVIYTLVRAFYSIKPNDVLFRTSPFWLPAIWRISHIFNGRILLYFSFVFIFAPMFWVLTYTNYITFFCFCKARGVGFSHHLAKRCCFFMTPCTTITMSIKQKKTSAQPVPPPTVIICFNLLPPSPANKLITNLFQPALQQKARKYSLPLSIYLYFLLKGIH